MDTISNRLNETFVDQLHIVHSDMNDENLILRLRFKDVRDELYQESNSMTEDESAVSFLKEIEDHVINELTLKGIREINKVYAKKYN